MTRIKLLSLIFGVLIISGCSINPINRTLIVEEHYSIYKKLKCSNEKLRINLEVEPFVDTSIAIIDRIENRLQELIDERSGNAFDIGVTRLVIINLTNYGPALQKLIHHEIKDEVFVELYETNENDWLFNQFMNTYPIVALVKLEVLKKDLLVTQLNN